MGLGESLAYNPIRDSGETLGERQKSRQESRQVTLQSLESDYMHGSPQDSLRDSFFTRVVELNLRSLKIHIFS